MDEPTTVKMLAELVERRVPFVHVRFGDGDVFFATGTGPTLTGDGEEWTPELADRLRSAWRALATVPNVLLGDVESYAVSDGCEAQWRELLEEWRLLRRDRETRLVHIEALRAGRQALDFYRAAATDDRRKVFVGPARLAGAARMLDAAHVHVPLHDSWRWTDELLARLSDEDPEVALFAAGRGGKIMQAHLALRSPKVTQVDVGSGLDILFDGVRRGTDAGIDVAALRETYRAAGLEL